MRAAVLLFAFAALAGCNNNPSTTTPGDPSHVPGPSSNSQGDTVRRAADLQVGTNQRVVLTGEVKSATEDIEPHLASGADRTPIVVLAWSDGNEVNCRFATVPALPAWHGALKTGQKFTVRGTVTAVTTGIVHLRDCEPIAAR